MTSRFKPSPLAVRTALLAQYTTLDARAREILSRYLQHEAAIAALPEHEQPGALEQLQRDAAVRLTDLLRTIEADAQADDARALDALDHTRRIVLGAAGTVAPALPRLMLKAALLAGEPR